MRVVRGISLKTAPRALITYIYMISAQTGKKISNSAVCTPARRFHWCAGIVVAIEMRGKCDTCAN